MIVINLITGLDFEGGDVDGDMWSAVDGVLHQLKVLAPGAGLVVDETA